MSCLPRFAALVVLTVGLLGCGNSRVAEVSGKVVVDGEPVPNGAILFFPVDGQSATSGSVIENGEYYAKVAVGKMKVSISVPKVVGKKKIYDTPNSPEMPVTKEALPPRYNEKTELTVDVEPGKNTRNFDLKSK